jgi:hypothetical protein
MKYKPLGRLFIKYSNFKAKTLDETVPEYHYYLSGDFAYCHDLIKRLHQPQQNLKND